MTSGRVRAAGSLAAALIGSLALGAVLLGIARANPLAAYWALLGGALGDRYHLAETAVQTIPLALVGLGAAVSLRAGVFSVGAGGQMAMGATGATAAVLAIGARPAPILLAAGLLAGAAAGAAWAFLPGVLRAFAGVNEILSTLLMNYLASYLLTWLLKGPMRNPASVATPQSSDLPAAALIPKALEQTRLHWGWLAVVLGVLLLAWWIRSSRGFGYDVFGARPGLARRMGVKPWRAIAGTMAISGAAAGIAGWIQVAGLQGRLYTSVAGGIGFNGVVVAILGGLTPLGILAAAAFFAILGTGAQQMQTAMSIPAAVAPVIQAVLLVAVALAAASRSKLLAAAPVTFIVANNETASQPAADAAQVLTGETHA
ncbi:MAG: ABC transporter permease [Chloroflexi bacterium]|nr:ABC transporter permease [Chloroflexota bacterium]